MYIGSDFSPASPGESELYTLDFSNDLATNESINTAVWSLSAIEGVDADAAVRLAGAASVTIKTTSQRIAGLQAGVKYLMQASVATTFGNTKVLYSHVACRTPS